MWFLGEMTYIKCPSHNMAQSAQARLEVGRDFGSLSELYLKQ